jgi:hypothetical protein
MPDTQGAVPLGQKPASPQPESPAEPAKALEIQYPAALPKSHYAKYREFLQRQSLNHRRETELHNRYAAGIQHSSVVGMRLQAFLDMVWPPGTPDGEKFRLEHELRYQYLLAEQWEDLQSQVIQARLQAGAQLSPAEQEVLMKMQQGNAPGLFGNPGHH